MEFKENVSELIEKRVSVRTFQKSMLSDDIQNQLQEIVHAVPEAPFQSATRLELIPFREGDEHLIKKLGTYGMIRSPRGFLAGAVKPGRMALVDLGYQMESWVLRLTEMDLGSCWLGGTFQKGRFAEQIGLATDEMLPVVIAFGKPESKPRLADQVARWAVGARKRLPWDALFFADDFEGPLQPSDLEKSYTSALEGVRLAPSASNKQPWRVVKESGKQIYHFYLKRSGAYHEKNHPLRMADFQKVDMGIAMCHFEAVVQLHGIQGQWRSEDPEMPHMPEKSEYVASWYQI